MYALIESGGQQHKVEPGRYITVKRLSVAEGEPVTFSSVLLVRGDEQIAVGAPVVEGAEVHGRIRRHFRGKKVHGFKYKAKKGYRRRWGARADLTQVDIDSIVFAGQTWGEAPVVESEPVADEVLADDELIADVEE